ncbi:MAG TPA: SDR family oxidoreductase [Iamia sp.]|jgi:nucleoside-diphosphate-sugar epimerase|nr:SDR family oxidoreductase [Iamia sp.]
MFVAVIGGHGQIARLLTRLLVARGHRVRAVIRNPDHVADVEADGAEAVVCDIEDGSSDLETALAGTDAVVFAAGAGPGSGPERKHTVDRDGVTRTVAAMERAGVGRLVVIGAMGIDDPPPDDEVFSVYLRAKAEADRIALASDLLVTVVRPGGLTDDEGTGHITIGRHVSPGRIPRADVAAVVAHVLDEPGSVGHIVEIVGGPTPIPEAVAEIATLPGGPT